MVAALLAAPLAGSAAADEAPRDCLGVDFSVAHPIGIARIIADRPQVHFVKSASDAAACPAEADVCLQQAYLIPGNLVLMGKTHGGFVCVAYESAVARKVEWTTGWIAAASLTPVLPSPQPSRGDWLGVWVHAAGHIIVKPAKNDRLAIRGEAFYAAAQNVHTGVIDATAKPSGYNSPTTAAPHSTGLATTRAFASCACSAWKRFWSSKTTALAAA